MPSCPQWLLDLAPQGMHAFLNGGGWLLAMLVAVLLVLLVVGLGAKKLLAGGGDDDSESSRGKKRPPLEEHLADYPPPKPSTGDRQLRVEGVPVRMRLLAIAPAGRHEDIDEDAIPDLLERILPGLGGIFTADKPRVRIWPVQLSYEGFAKHFHRNTIVPEKEGQPTPWVVVAGRAKLGKQQVMIGLGLLAVKPTTVGRKNVEAHEWPTVFRVRVRD